MNGQEWDIRSPATACAACARAFEDGETFTSRLCFEEAAGYERRDYCEACVNSAPADAAVSVWKTVFHKAPPPPEETLKKETAESLLRQLMETGDPARANAIFVLAVMLERRRLLVERDVQELEDGVRRRIYEHKGTGETFVILDPGLRLNDLEQVQTEVTLMLGGTPPGGVPVPPAAPGPAPAEPAASADRVSG